MLVARLQVRLGVFFFSKHWLSMLVARCRDEGVVNGFFFVRTD